MTVYQTEVNPDGTLKLSAEQLAELREKGFSSEKIYAGLLRLYDMKNSARGISSADLPPCAACGSSDFLRTGTCHVCQTCGDSQGCS